MTDRSLKLASRALDARKYNEAAALYEPLADAGVETALLNLGWMYKNGHLGSPDLDKAISLYERASNKGSAIAKHYLGRSLMEKGELNRARSLFLEGAMLGNKACMTMAGKMLVRGLGGEQNVDVGTTWLVRAADAGQLFAQRELLRMEVHNSRSLLHRFFLYLRIVKVVLVAIPRMVLHPLSDDFR